METISKREGSIDECASRTLINSQTWLKQTLGWLRSYQQTRAWRVPPHEGSDQSFPECDVRDVV